VIETVVGIDARFIPQTREFPVVRALVPPRMLFAVPFPMVLPEIVSDVVTPDTTIPVTAPATAAVTPEDWRAPIRLFWRTTVPVELVWIPTTAACVVVEVAARLPVPVVAPIVFGVTVPTFTSPDVMLMPQRTPYVVAAPLDVPRVMAATVFPWTEVGVTLPTASSIPMNRVAIVPVIAVTPEAAAEA
jgi:hypothetical protein